MSEPMICLLGPIAAGKTTAAELLAAALGAELIREDFENNPLLAEAYRGREEFRLPSQLWYLLSRVNQLSRARQIEDRPVVVDYAFCQDWVYAHIWLEGDQLAAYESVFAEVQPLVRRADVLIHLDADPAELLGRISRRGRGFEQNIDADLLNRLRAGYRDMLASAGCEVIQIDTAEVDLRTDPARASLLQELRCRLHRPS